MSPVFLSPVVSTQWLADHLGSESLVLLDVSVRTTEAESGAMHYAGDHEAYVAGHIPGAIFVDLPADFAASSTGLEHPGADDLVAAIRAAGIGDTSRVVLYDRDFGQWATRLWWLLQTAGVAEAAVVDGGLFAWRSEHRSLETGSVPTRSRDFTPVLRAELWAQAEDVTLALDGSSALLTAFDTPNLARVAGVIAAHPRSVNLRPQQLHNRDDHTLLADRDLRGLYEPVTAGKRPIICVGEGGVSASANALALTLLGETNVRVFDGPATTLLAG